MKSVGIIGGGPAGITLAYNLQNLGFQVTLFEADSDLGGLVRSFPFGDIRIERYYHFLCGDDLAYFEKLHQLGLSERLRWKPTKMGFFHDGITYPFASAMDLLRFGGMSLSGRLRYGLWALRCSVGGDWRALDGIAAKPWLIKNIGLDAYNATWHPLLDIKFHEHHGEISAAWIWHRVHRVSRSRKHLFAQEQLGYLDGGTDVLLDALIAGATRRGALFRKNTPVRRIHIENHRATAVELQDGRKEHFDRLVSAVPLPVFLRLAPDLPAGYLDRLKKIEFLGVVCVVFRLKRSLTPNYWLNVNDPRIPFNGCIEYTNLNPGMTPDGTSIVYVPFYLPTSHKHFRCSDERLLEECLRSFALIQPDFSPDWVVDAVVSRDLHAQVVCKTGFASQVPLHQTPISNLMLIESSQLYPSDRTVSGTIELADKVTEMLGKE